jgi:tetratricopeptide (TPR) repeat protein
MGMKRSKRLAKELAHNRSVRLGERHISKHIVRCLCEEADEVMDCGSNGLRIAQLAIRIAAKLSRIRRWRRRPAVSRELALSFARLAAALRSTGRLDHAERALKIAFEVAPPQLKGDLFRRRAWLKLYQRSRLEAVQNSKKAVRLSVGQEHALALGALGVMLDYCGNHRTATRKLAESLAELDPESERRYCGTLVSYAIVLAKGDTEEAKKALKLFPALRSKFKDRHKMQRAKTWWVEGLLHRRLDNPQKARQALDTARRSLVALKAAPEIAAVVADMARVSPLPLAVRHICSEAALVITATHPLREPLRALAHASHEMIPNTAATLWEASVALAPCPAL